MTYTALLTIAGQTKLAAFATGGPAVTLTHVAVGDAAGVPYTPVENQTALTGEKYRAGVSALGAAAGGIITVEAVIPADANDASNRPSHGFQIHELGVFDSTGTLIAVARMNGGLKPSPASGQAESITLQVKIDVGNASAVTVTIDPSATVHLGRLSLMPWIAVISDTVTAPPVNAQLGDSYLIPAGATGAWLNHSGKIAHMAGGWYLLSPPISTVVQVTNRALNDPSKFLRKTSAAGWSAFAASPTVYGMSRYATGAEARAGVLDNVAISPLELARYIGAPLESLPYPEVLSASQTLLVTPSIVAGQGGNVSVAADQRIKLGAPFADDASLGSYNEYLTPAFTSINLLPNATYYLRAQISAGLLVIYVQQGTDADAVPGSLKGTPNGLNGGGFDSTRFDINLARITTGAAGTLPVVLSHRNAALLSFRLYKQTPTLGQYPQPGTVATVYNNGAGDSIDLFVSGGVQAFFRYTLNWGRKPTIVIKESPFIWVGSANIEQYVSAAGANYLLAGDRYAQNVRVDGGYVQTRAFTSNTLNWLSWWAGCALFCQG